MNKFWFFLLESLSISSGSMLEERDGLYGGDIGV